MSEIKVMSEFEQVISHNKTIEANLVSSIQNQLRQGKVTELVAQMKPVLQRMGVADKEVASITKAFTMLQSMPFEQWLSFLVPLMTSLINKTPSGGQAFFDQNQFPWVTEIESRWPLMIKEIEAALACPEKIPAFQQIQPAQENLTQDDLWKVIVFRGYGDELEQNQQVFPQVSKALDLIPDCSSAMVSILAPGKHIKPHTGPYKGVLRYHLGLKVPEDCAITVNGITQAWQEGKSMIFDDTFVHEAWNKSSSMRAVLFVDFLRPLIFPFNLINEFISMYLIRESRFITDTKQNLNKYDDLLDYLKGER